MIPVLKPVLPSFEDLEPLLRQIDQNQWYTNHGPLVQKLEERLSQRFRQGGHYITACNATLALTVTLQSLNLPAKSRCIVPSWTFPASPLSIVAAGLEPYFVDLDNQTHLPCTQQIRDLVADPHNHISALMVTYPFGQPIDDQFWESLAQELEIELIFDAAAAFDGWQPTNVPSVISLHATKILPGGEGAFIYTKDHDLALEIRARTTFGFNSSGKTSVYLGTNAKLSEYHAAIALHSLSHYDLNRTRLYSVAKQYILNLQDCPVSLPKGLGDWLTMTLNIKVPSSLNLNELESYLADHHVETRRWWTPCHTMPAFQAYPRVEDLSSTQHQYSTTLGIPFGRNDQIIHDVPIVCSLICDWMKSGFGV